MARGDNCLLIPEWLALFFIVEAFVRDAETEAKPDDNPTRKGIGTTL